MRLKILAEGSTKWQRFVKHWGLSILIDDDILFDTFGRPDYILKQLKQFHIDVDKIRHIVISHDDWDHVAGLWKILERNQNLTVYICPHFKPEIKAKIQRHGACLIETKGVTNLRDNIYLSGELTGSRDNCDIPEQYLTIKTSKGLVVITGCAHPGIVEIVQHAKTCFGQDVQSLIGGFHLKDHAVKEAYDIILRLKALGLGQVIPFHCTGRIAQKLFEKEFKQDCIIPSEGQIIEI
ncbi:MAG: MBL fold metallo-hydrolase [Candidatus Omnitrophica bacterium]|nr:MBL fold metallo-hydrolase [Candidatus Omnitrophota bacterium]